MNKSLRAQRIVDQLGMPHGTAANKLRKNIMFDMCRRLNENICHKCGDEIIHVDDLSIEHKLPWEGRDANLFWDLSNIAFSHIQCNRCHFYKNDSQTRRKIGPDGTAWCRTCNDFLPVDNFAKDATRWHGLRNICKDCLKESKVTSR